MLDHKNDHKVTKVTIKVLCKKFTAVYTAQHKFSMRMLVHISVWFSFAEGQTNGAHLGLQCVFFFLMIRLKLDEIAGQN